MARTVKEEHSLREETGKHLEKPAWLHKKLSGTLRGKKNMYQEQKKCQLTKEQCTSVAYTCRDVRKDKTQNGAKAGLRCQKKQTQCLFWLRTNKKEGQ